jgi:hypothetical protein
VIWSSSRWSANPQEAEIVTAVRVGDDRDRSACRGATQDDLPYVDEIG